MKSRHVLGTMLALAALVGHFGCDEPRLRKDHHVGERPYALAVGDFNGDLRPDLAVSTWEGVDVLLNLGAGELGQRIRAVAVNGVVVTGDFDGDGRDDLASRDSILLSRGDGTFSVGQATGSQPLGTGDFNLDNMGDLLIGGDDGALLWLATGEGRFDIGTEITSDPVRQVLVADFNVDGLLDVAVLPISSPALPVRIFPGQGDGTFGPGVATQIDALGLLTADFNGDRIPDLFTQGCAVCAPGTTGLALGKGDGSFRPPMLVNIGDPIAAADINGDGWADVVTEYGTSNEIYIFSGLGDGTFEDWDDPRPVGWGTHMATAVDLDGGGSLDVVASNFSSNTVTILLAYGGESAIFRRAVSSASDSAIVAPESLATLMSPWQLSSDDVHGATASPPWPTSLGGVSLEVRDSEGVTRLAPLISVATWRIEFQVPDGTSPGEARLFVGSIEVGRMQVEPVAPGLFMASPMTGTPSALGVYVEPDGTQIPVSTFRCSSGNVCQAEPLPLSSVGNRPMYLGFYGTGFHDANTENVTCFVNGVQQPVVYAGPQGGTPGLDQINVRLLPELLVQTEEGSVGPGPVTATLWIDGVAANSVVIDLS